MKPLAPAKVLLAVSLPICAVGAQGTAEQEPNDGPATANLHALGTQSFGVLAAGDVDWYRVVLPRDRDLRAWTAPGFGSQCGNTRLALFDAQARLINEVDDGSPATHGDYSVVEFGDLAAGTWFLRVRGFDAQTTGSYTLDVEALGVGDLVRASHQVVSVVEEPEPNDPRMANSTMTAGPLWALVRGNIAVGAGTASLSVRNADYDFYKIQVPSAGLLSLTTAAGPAPSAFDTVLHLCDAGLAPLAFDDDSGPGFFALLRYQVTVPGIYYVVISDYGTGNYELEVDFAPPMPAGAAQSSVLSGGCGPTGGVPRLGTRWTTGSTMVRVERPILGTQYYVDLTNCPPNTLIARLFNLLPRQWPLSLDPFGAPGCVSEVDNPVVDFSTTDAAGVHYWGFSISDDVSMIGLPLEKQVAVLDPAANALGLRMSNRMSSVVGVGF
ncbi:MAG: PPC domain-containing protein [Planctomycetes bacterium]|nr:PPC domain-containing protein [Planctomycetota bacterium]